MIGRGMARLLLRLGLAWAGFWGLQGRVVLRVGDSPQWYPEGGLDHLRVASIGGRWSGNFKRTFVGCIFSREF